VWRLVPGQWLFGDHAGITHPVLDKPGLIWLGNDVRLQPEVLTRDPQFLCIS
jgi:hypothetical protein